MAVRLAAIGDLHVRFLDGVGTPARFPSLAGRADLLLLAGDLTDNGLLSEAERAAEALSRVGVPVAAVLGNHDLRCIRRAAFRRILRDAGVTLLEGSGTVVTTGDGTRIGVAGVTGCGGGFWPTAGPERFPSRAMKALAVRARRETARLAGALRTLECDVTVVLTHFAPTATTLGREPLAKYWMLGNVELGRVIDRHAVDLALHGHAHLGCPSGWTAGGVPVRNVAAPVTGGVTVFDVPVTARFPLDRRVRPPLGRTA